MSAIGRQARSRDVATEQDTAELLSGTKGFSAVHAHRCDEDTSLCNHAKSDALVQGPIALAHAELDHGVAHVGQDERPQHNAVEIS